MIDENSPSSPKRRGPRGVGRPIQIQERDLDILYSLSVGRYLTAPAIEWLHYPRWRERYKRYLDQQQSDESLIYRPTNEVYRRLVAMRAGEAPLVYRLTRTNERARLAYTRLADAYALAEAGAELLSTHSAVPGVCKRGRVAAAGNAARRVCAGCAGDWPPAAWRIPARRTRGTAEVSRVAGDRFPL